MKVIKPPSVDFSKFTGACGGCGGMFVLEEKDLLDPRTKWVQIGHVVLPCPICSKEINFKPSDS